MQCVYWIKDHCVFFRKSMWVQEPRVETGVALLTIISNHLWGILGFSSLQFWALQGWRSWFPKNALLKGHKWGSIELHTHFCCHQRKLDSMCPQTRRWEKGSPLLHAGVIDMIHGLGWGCCHLIGAGGIHAEPKLGISCFLLAPYNCEWICTATQPMKGSIYRAPDSLR